MAPLTVRSSGLGFGRCRAVAAFALGSALVLNPAVTSASEGTRPAAGRSLQTFVTMLSDRGDYIGGGQHRLFYPGNATISVQGNLKEFRITVSGGTHGDAYDLTFAAPPGKRLHPGFYPDAQRTPFREAGHPGIDVYGDGRGCNVLTGALDVKDIRRGPNGRIKRVWLTYEQHCEGGPAALFGEVRIAVPGARGGLMPAPGTVWWPAIDVSAAATVVPVWFVGRNLGATVRSVGVRGVASSAFDIRADDCSGATIGPGEACQVFVRFQPGRGGPHTGRLVLTDTEDRAYTVTLDGPALGGRTRWTMTSDEGDYIGQGQSYEYTPASDSIGAGGDRNAVFLGVEGADGNWWGASFDAPDGDILAAGTTYEGAIRYPFNGPAPGLDVSGSGRGCNELDGEFTVTHLKTASDGSMTSFGVEFEQHCEHMDPALRGTIEFRVPVGDTTPPGPVTALSISRVDGAAVVKWKNPGAQDFAFTVVRFLRSRWAPGTPNGSLLAYSGGGTSTRISGVGAQQRVTVAVYSVDGSGNFSGPVLARLAPSNP